MRIVNMPARRGGIPNLSRTCVEIWQGRIRHIVPTDRSKHIAKDTSGFAVAIGFERDKVGIMIDALKKAMLAGLGAAVLTKEKAEAALADWVRQGKISADEAKEMVARLTEQGKVEFDSAAKDVQRSVKDLMEQAGIGQKGRLDSMEKRLLAVEIELANLVAQSRKQPPQ
jgi:polyhydroxyalkanoate synthesis regulator phasin